MFSFAVKHLKPVVLASISLYILLFYASGLAEGRQAQKALLIINKSTNQMAFFKDGELVRIFDVATGKSEELTPEGTFSIVNKIKNRPYYKEKIPGGDPNNPLGDRWLGLHVGHTYGTTYAIHGNNNENSIGKYVSKGCVRMHNKDIRWLFEEVENGTNVVITSSEQSFEKLAASHGYDLMTPFPGKVFVGMTPYVLDQPFLLFREKTYVPMREILELMNGIVHWDPSSQQMISTVGDMTVIHTPSSNEFLINGERFEMESASLAKNGHIMIPIRDFSELFGWSVHWEGETQSIFLEF